MSGEYREQLSSGGELVVSEKEWHIKYYFPGPDYRYNGTVVTVNGVEIEKYIKAWQNNFHKFITLKKKIPRNGTFETEGSMGMSIRIGEFNEGVCIRSYHMPISTKRQLNQVIFDYSKAKNKVKEAQKMLRSL